MKFFPKINFNHPNPAKQFSVAITIIYTLLFPFLPLIPFILDAAFLGAKHTETNNIFIITLFCTSYLAPLSVPPSVGGIWYYYAKKSYNKVYLFGIIPLITIVAITTLFFFIGALR